MARFSTHAGGAPGPQGPAGDPANTGDLAFEETSINGVGVISINSTAVPGWINLSAYEGAYVNGTDDPGNKIVTFDDLESAPVKFGSYGSFYDTTTQTGTTNSIQAMTLNTTDMSDGVSIVSQSRITIANAGKYNIAFSAQLAQTNSSGTINIWLRKNGVDVSNTNTKINIASNNPYSVAAWNFFVDASANDYFELVWSSTSANTLIAYEAANSHPAIPSLILTVNQVGL